MHPIPVITMRCMDLISFQRLNSLFEFPQGVLYKNFHCVSGIQRIKSRGSVRANSFHLIVMNVMELGDVLHFNLPEERRILYFKHDLRSDHRINPVELVSPLPQAKEGPHDTKASKSLSVNPPAGWELAGGSWGWEEF